MCDSYTLEIGEDFERKIEFYYIYLQRNILVITNFKKEQGVQLRLCQFFELFPKWLSFNITVLFRKIRINASYKYKVRFCISSQDEDLGWIRG